jgi:hypothetical protein
MSSSLLPPSARTPSWTALTAIVMVAYAIGARSGNLSKGDPMPELPNQGDALSASGVSYVCMRAASHVWASDVE